MSARNKYVDKDAVLTYQIEFETSIVKLDELKHILYAKLDNPTNNDLELQEYQFNGFIIWQEDSMAELMNVRWDEDIKIQIELYEKSIENLANVCYIPEVRQLVFNFVG